MIINMSGSGSSVKTVTVHVLYKSSVNITCTNGKKTYTGMTDTNCNAIFKLPKDIWTITADQDGYTSSIKVNVSEDCTVNISIFSAVIHVTYPAGFTCIARDGVSILTAPNTSGTWDCVVPNAGTWTFELNSGLASAVDVINNGDTFYLNQWYLYNVGDQCTAVTGGWQTEIVSNGTAILNTDSITVSARGKGSKGWVTTINMIDLSPFNTLRFNVTNWSSGDNSNNRCLCIICNSSGTIISQTNVYKAGVYTIDVSSLQSNYIKLYAYSAAGYKHTMTVNKIWLEA